MDSGFAANQGMRRFAQTVHEYSAKGDAGAEVVHGSMVVGADRSGSL